MTRTSSAFLCAWALLVGCSDSSKATQLVVAITSDMDVPAELDAFDVRVFGPVENLVKQQRFELGPGKVELPASFGVTPRGGDASRTVTIEIDAFRAGTLLFTARTVTGFVAGRTLRLDTRLSAACSSKICSQNTTCRQGACVDPFVDPATLPRHTPGVYPGIDPDMDGGTDSGTIDPCEATAATIQADSRVNAYFPEDTYPSNPVIPTSQLPVFSIWSWHVDPSVLQNATRARVTFHRAYNDDACSSNANSECPFDTGTFKLFALRIPDWDEDDANFNRPRVGATWEIHRDEADRGALLGELSVNATLAALQYELDAAEVGQLVHVNGVVSVLVDTADGAFTAYSKENVLNKPAELTFEVCR
jgi:hypothetical protein